MPDQTGLLQEAVGHPVAVIAHHLTGGKRQGVGTVIPLFTLSVNLALATAADQFHLTEA